MYADVDVSARSTAARFPVRMCSRRRARWRRLACIH
jgi:hypothetical protein